jgi:hypothetical protein
MMKREHKQSVMDNPTIKEVASKNNKAAAEVSRLFLKRIVCEGREHTWLSASFICSLRPQPCTRNMDHAA